MIRAGQIAKGALDRLRPDLDYENRLAIHCHNLMGGEIDFAALATLAELYDARDADELLDRIAQVRDHVHEHAGRARGPAPTTVGAPPRGCPDNR